MRQVYPHSGVWARLGVSELHGIGVFAILPIPTGTDIFENDVACFHWTDADALRFVGLTPQQRRLYEDFAVGQDGRLGCPRNFNLLTVGWYLNQPADGDFPNVTATSDYRMIAAREIVEGEELTVRYDTFSER